MIKTEIIHRRRLRFTLPAAGYSITYQNICDSINVATATTTAYQLFDFVKVEKVEMWAETSLGTTANMSLNFLGQSPGSVGDQDAWADSSMGIQPAYISARPSPKATASTWQAGSNSGTAFSVNSNVIGIIDVVVSFKVNEQYLAATVQHAPSGLSAGNIYYRSLDGAALGAFTPQGVNNVD